MAGENPRCRPRRVSRGALRSGALPATGAGLAGGGGVRLPGPRRVVEHHLERGPARRPRGRARPRRARAPRRGAVRDPLLEPARVGARGSGRPLRGRRDDDDLPVLHRGGVRPRPVRLRRAGLLRRGRRAGRPARGAPGRAPPPAPRRRVRRHPERRRMGDHLDRPPEPRARRPRDAAGAVRRPRAGDRAVRARDAHLHLGDDREAEGGGAHPRLLALAVGGAGGERSRRSRRRAAALLPAVRPLVRQDDDHPAAPGGVPDRDRRAAGAALAEPPRDPPHLRLRGASHLREDPRGGARAGARGRRAAQRAPRLGAPRRPRRGPPRARGATPRAPPRGAARAGRSARAPQDPRAVRRAPAALHLRFGAARARGRTTSSPRPASRSWRATASPRPPPRPT